MESSSSTAGLYHWNKLHDHQMIPPYMNQDPVLEVRLRNGDLSTRKCSEFKWNILAGLPGRILEWRNTHQQELPPSTYEEPDPEIDHGAHYRYEYKAPIYEENIDDGYVTVKLDPFRISQVYGGLEAPQFTMLKKVLRLGTSVKDKRQDYLDIISAAERGLEMLDEDLK